MKIVRIIARLNVGGPARHVVWLTKELQNEEFDSLLVAGSVPEGEQSMEYFAGEHGVEPVYIREMSRELSPKDLVSLWKVFRLLVKEKPDIVHTHTAKAGTVGRLAALFYKILVNRRLKTVHTYHGHVFHSYYGNLKTRIFIAIEKILAVVATDRIIAITDQQRREINETYGVGESAKFRVVPLGIDLGLFASVASQGKSFRSEINAAEGDVVVGLVARLTEIKNIDMFIDAAAKLRSSRSGADVHFAVVGDGNVRGELEARAATADSGVVFMGNRNDAAEFYAGLDIVALTSLNEGTPLSLIEGMAAGKAVIATSVGGVVDLLGKVVEKRDGFDVCERGLGVSSGDVDGFTRGLETLVSDPMLRETLGARGREFVTGRYGKSRLVEDISELYRALVSAES